jgi:hypothetical protein
MYKDELMVFLAKTFLFGRELTLWEAGAGI